MSRDLGSAVRRWLAEERAESDGGAEEALAAAFAALPAPEPPAGFPDRVLAAAGVAAAPVAEGAAEGVAGRIGRWAGIAALLAGGLTAAFLPLVMTAVGPAIGLRRGVEALAALLLGACRWLVEALSFWESLASAGAALSVVVSKPPLMLALAGALLVSGAALALLYRLLLSDQRSTENVRSQ